MPGTILLDDARDEIERQLKRFATGISDVSSGAQRGLTQVVGDVQAGAQQAQRSLYDVQQELGQHAQNLIDQGEQSVINVNQQRQRVQDELTNYATSLGQPTQPATQQPITSTETQPGGDLHAYARQAAQRAGVDPDIFERQIQQESGFRVDAKSPAGATGVAQIMPNYHPGVDPTDPYASLDYAANLMKSNLAKYGGDYAKALAAYNAGGGNVDKYGGVPPFEETQRYVDTIMRGSSGATAPSVQEGLERVGSGTAARQRDVSQFGDAQLTSAEAYAACGPAAAVRFAERFGRNPTLREAVDIARTVGWTEQTGMAGLSSQKSLMDRLGVATRQVGPDWGAIAREASTGNPVTISTQGHYFYADGYDPQSGAFHVGRSGLDLRGGKEWMTSAEMEQRMGALQGALFADSPNVPTKSTAAAGRRGTDILGDNSMQVAGVQAAQPLRMTTYMAAGQEDEGGFPAAVRRGIDLVGDTATEVRRRVEELNQPPLAGAPPIDDAINQAIRGGAEAVGGFVSDVGRGAQQANADVREALRLNEPSELNLEPSPGGGGLFGVRPQPFEPGSIAAEVEAGRRDTRDLSPAEGLQYTAQIMGAGLPATFETYRGAAGAKRELIEAQNPLNALPVPAVAGGTSMLADVLTDPITWALPWGRVASGAADLAISAGLNPVAGRIGGEALMNGLQNAALEMAQPDPTPEKIGQAFLIGAGFGGAVRGGLEVPQVQAAQRRVGQWLLEQRGQGWPSLREFLTSEEGALNIPGPRRDVLEGQAVPRPGYEPNSPEFITEDTLSNAARSQGTARPNLTQDEIRQLPGLSGSLTSDLNEVREAIEAGLPAARWYTRMVEQIRQDTGQDINPREAAVLMGAFGGNAGVPPNYHAMLSAFDAMRQVMPDLAGLEGMDVPQIMASPAFKAVQAAMAADKVYVDWTMLARVMRGYRTGEIPVPSGAKLSSYTQNFLHALNDLYDPYSTQDVWQGRLFGQRLQSSARGAEPIPGSPDVAGSDEAYRSMHALTNWIARELHIPPRDAQAAGWTVFRTLWTDPVIGPDLRTGAKSLRQAIAEGQQSGILNVPQLQTGGMAEVTGPRGVNAWLDKINDVRDRIRQNGSYNAAPPDSATALNEWALYHPSIRTAARARETGYGKAVGTRATTPERPVGNAPAAVLRDLAVGDSPILRVAGEITDLDPQTGRIRWLLPEHDVQRAGPNTYVNVVGVGDDAAQVIGRRLGADIYNHADPTSTRIGGVSIDGLPGQRDQAAVARALQAQGMPVIREQVGTGIRVPLTEGRIAALNQRVQQVLASEGVSGVTVGGYKGETHAVQSAGVGRATGGRVGTAARRALGLPAGDDVRSQQLAASLFSDADYPIGPPGQPGAGRPGRVSGAGNERFHYTVSGDFDQFRTGERGAVYLAETPMQALAGAQAGWRETVRRSPGIPIAVREERGRLMRVDPSEARVFQDQWPDRLTETEFDAAQQRFDDLKQGQSPDVQRALDRLRSISVGRHGEIDDVVRSITYSHEPRVLSHVEAETPAMQQALRLMGADAVRVGDEAGTSLAVIEPSKLRITGRAPAQALPIPSINLAGAAVGGYAGSAATPEGEPLDVRLRNIGIGATAGLLGTAAITRRGGRLAEALAGRTERASARETPFRAPQGDILAATTGEPPTGPVGAGRPTPPGREPQRLGDVQTNRWALREPRAGETPMTDDELASYWDTLDQRLEDVRQRFDAVDEMLRNPEQKVERPPWGARYTNLELARIARAHDVSPYEEAWWDKVGLESGSGEVRENVGQGGFKTYEGREPTPTELRAERNALAKEQRDILDTAEQIGSAGPGQRFVRAVAEGSEAGGELPFDTGLPDGAVEAAAEATSAPGIGGARTPGAIRAQEIVEKNYRLRSEENRQVLGERGGVTGRGIVAPEAVVPHAPDAETKRLMPNLDALLGGDMPEVRAQIQKAVEDNPELMREWQQGTITHAELQNDLAARTGMTMKDWLKTPVGKAFNEREIVALQAASVEAELRSVDLAKEILAKGGVDKLSPEEVAFSLTTLVDTQRLLAVARGGRATAGRALNALKIRMTDELATRISGQARQRAARREADAARRATKRATDLIDKTSDLDKEAGAARASARDKGASRNILQQIDDAYAQLDRYQAMTLHEKETVWKQLQKERADRAAARKAKVRDAPEELLSALKAELKAEQKIFAGRKDNWETQAFWDSEANAIAAEKRNAFRGGLYIEQQRRAAQNAARTAEAEAEKAFDDALRRRVGETDRAKRLLEALGGEAPTKELLSAFVEAVNSGDQMAAAKFLQGTMKQSNWVRANTIRLAGLLSSPITHAVNVGGNVANALVEIPTRALTIGIDAFRAGLTGGERQAYWAEMQPMLAAYGPGFLQALPDAARVLKNGVTPAQLADLSKLRPGLTGNAVADAAFEMPLRALGAEDVLFRSAAYSAHAQRVAIREAMKEGYRGTHAQGRAESILKNFTDFPDLAKEAQDAAARMVYQERRQLPLIGSGLNETPAMQFGRSQILPFVRTPANITAQGAAMSPLGFLGSAQATMRSRGMARGTIAEQRAAGRETLLAEERLARATIGTAILGVGVWLGASKMLTAGYPEDASLRNTLPQGWRPWSLKLDDPVTGNTYYVPYQNLGPMGMPLAMAAIATDPSHRNKSVLDPDEVGGASTAIGRYVIDNTFLQGLNDFNDLLHDPRTNASKFLEPLAASYGPYSSLAREMNRSFGVAQRNPHEGIRGLIEAWEANYPGLAGNVPEATTALGEPKTQGATGFGRYVVPARYDIERDEPALRTLRENDVGIPNAPKDLNVIGGHIKLTEEEQDQLKRARGAAIREVVNRVASDPRFQRADQVTRTKMLKENVNATSRFTNEQWLRSLGASTLRQRTEAKAQPEPYYLD